MTVRESMRATMMKLPGVSSCRNRLDNQYERDGFVISQLSTLPLGSLILDAGCGSQRYRQYCEHLTYKSQDFGQYTTDVKAMIGTKGIGGEAGYSYGQLDYVGNIWNVDEKDAAFDAILCTEVFEHIAYPNDTIKEFSRLLKANGTLILTAPSNCLRHMDPYFFYSGFSDRWYETLLPQHGFTIEILEPVGDYYGWMATEVARTAMANSLLAKLLLFPAFVYYYNKTATRVSIDTLCTGYHVVARKLPLL